MNIKLDNRNGHDQRLIDMFNLLIETYDEGGIITELVRYFDDKELEGFCDHLLEREDLLPMKIGKFWMELDGKRVWDLEEIRNEFERKLKALEEKPATPFHSTDL